MTYKRCSIVFSLALAVTLSSSLPLVAAPLPDHKPADDERVDDSKWSLKLTAAAIRPQADSFDSAVGWGLAAAYQASRRWSVEISAIESDLAWNQQAQVLESVAFQSQAKADFKMLLAGMRYHFTPDGPVDIYAGPVAGFMDNGRLQGRDIRRAGNQVSSQAFDLKTRLAWVWGAQAGIDVPVGDDTFTTSSVTYLQADVRPDHGFALPIEVNPLIIQTGFGARF